MKPSGRLFGFPELLVVIVVTTYFSHSVQADCDSTYYTVETTGFAGSSAEAEATRGVPFFPECELPNNRKYFRVKSPTDAAIFLSPLARVEGGGPYYLIELPHMDTVSGEMILYKSVDGLTQTAGDAKSTVSALNLVKTSDFVDLYVGVTADGYIQVGKKKADGTDDEPILSWLDVDGVIDVNYILVQNFNDGAGTTPAEWQFCDGAVTLLSYNYDTKPAGVSTGQRDTIDGCPGCGPDEAIDGLYNVFDDEFQCTYLEDTETTATDGDEPGIWGIDLGNMYDIKAVLILNGLGGGGGSVENELETAEVRIGSCASVDGSISALFSDVKDNKICGTKITMAEARDQDEEWIMRECDKNFYGQFVFIIKDDPTVSITYFSLCEVEVWGQAIPADKKYKLGLTIEGEGESVSALERDEAPEQKYNVIVKSTGGSAENPTCLKYDIVRSDGDTNGIGTQGAPTGVRDCTAEASDDDANDNSIVATGLVFEPTDTYTDTKTDAVTFYPDICDEDDEAFTYTIVPDTKGVVAGDPGSGTYETITFDILNDDVTYCWKELSVSALEGSGKITAVLIRSGYTAITSTAVVNTAFGATIPAQQSDFTALTNHQVVFPAGETEVAVEVIIIDDDCYDGELTDETLNIVFDPALSDGGICAPGGTALDTVIGTILNDDVYYIFQDNGPATVNNARVYTVSESDTTNTEVVVERVGYIDIPTTIRVRSEQWTIDAEAATPVDDYVVIDKLLTFASGIKTDSVSVTIVNDKKVEPDTGADTEEIFQLILVKDPTSLDDCVLGTEKTANIRIKDDDCYFSLMPDTFEDFEANGPASTTIFCKRPDCGACTLMNRPFAATLSIDTNGITGDGVTVATSPDDFTERQNEVVILPGVATGPETSVAFTWPIKNDNIEEPDESFVIRLTGSDGEITDADRTTVNIKNDDATVSLDCQVSNVAEGAGKITATLQRSGYLVESDSVLLFTNPETASADRDYESTLVTKTFDSMDATITQDVIINQDVEREENEYFTVKIEPKTAETVVDPDKNICRWTITDDDCTATIFATDANKRVTEGSVSSITLTVTRSGYMGNAATIAVYTSTINGATESDATPGEDFISLSTVVTFPPNEDTQQVSVTINDDEETEGTEYFVVSLGDGDCPTGGDNKVVITVIDDDTSAVRMSDPKITVSEGVEGGMALVSVSRTGSLNKPETAYLSVRPYNGQDSDSATPGSDFTIDDDITVEFGADEDIVQIRIPINDDTFEEGLESFVIEIIRLAGDSDATIDNLARETVVCIRDDDGTFILEVFDQLVSEGTSVLVNIRRRGDTTKEQTVYLSTADVDASGAIDYQSLRSQEVVFPPNADLRPYRINTLDDQELEGPESFTVLLTSNDGSDLGQRSAVITILDDDHEIRFVSVPGSLLVQNAVIVPESADYAILTIERSSFGNNLPSGSATVTVAARELSSTGIPQPGVTPAEKDGVERDFEFSTETVSFSSGQKRADVTVKIIDDNTGENQEAFEVYLSNAEPFGDNKIVYPNTVTVYIVDDDGGAADGGDGGDGGAGDGDGDGTTTLSQPLIIGIAGGIGLLVLIIVLLFIGLALFSQLRGPAAAAAPAPRAAPAPAPQYQYPQVRNGPRQPRRVAYYP